jgi:hypothetical protein
VNLLLIAQKLWSYKLVTLPILVFVALGAFYVVFIKPSVYEASATYVLVNPPAPPSDTAIARNPELAHIDADNPYTRYPDQSVVVQVLAGRLNSEKARRELERKGADPTYAVAPSPEFGSSAPIFQVTGRGGSPEEAIRTANVVGLAVTSELDRMQGAQSVDPEYRIVTQQIVGPHDAELKASGKLRTLVAVLALGAVMLFIAVSIADAVTTVQAQRGRAGSEPAFDEPFLPVELHRGENGASAPTRGVRPWAVTPEPGASPPRQTPATRTGAQG